MLLSGFLVIPKSELQAELRQPHALKPASAPVFNFLVLRPWLAASLYW